MQSRVKRAVSTFPTPQTRGVRMAIDTPKVDTGRSPPNTTAIPIPPETKPRAAAGYVLVTHWVHVRPAARPPVDEALR